MSSPFAVNRTPLAVLCLHRVLPARYRGGPDEPYFRRQTAIEAERFSGLLDALCSRCVVLDPHALAGWLAGSVEALPSGRPVVALTFDDGYADVVEFALPEMARRGLRAVVCVTTRVATGQQRAFPVDVWYGVLATATRRRGRLEEFGVEPWDFDLTRDGDVERLIDGPEKRAFVHASAEARVVLLGRLRQALGGSEAAGPRTLGAAEVRELAQAGWLIGSHGSSHALLTRLTRDETLGELIESREWLRGLGLPAAEIIAYPDGAVDDAVEDLAAQAGYRVGLALGGRVVLGDSLLRVPRLIVKNEDDWLERRLMPLFGAAVR